MINTYAIAAALAVMVGLVLIIMMAREIVLSLRSGRIQSGHGYTRADDPRNFWLRILYYVILIAAGAWAISLPFTSSSIFRLH
jgi:hypothetical protein